MSLDFNTPVRFRGVCRNFGETKALVDIDLEIPAGGTVGLLGPNGSGKTTLLSLISGLREPTRGTVTLFGRNPQLAEARVRLGVTPQHSGIVKGMTVLQLIRFITGHFVDHEPPETLLEAFGIDHLARKRIGGLSGGQQRLLSVALAFAGRPLLVLLDEPSTGLDVNARHHLWEAIRRRSQQGTTILLTSHYLEEVQALSDRIVMIQRGHIVADNTTSEILRQTGVTLVKITTSDERTLALPGAQRAWREGKTVVLATHNASAVTKALAQAGIDYSDVDIQKPNLEEAFARLSTS